MRHENTEPENLLADLITEPAKVAKSLGVSYTTVRNWVELNAIPPRRVIAVAAALDVEIPVLLEFARKATKPAKTLKKTSDDLDALLAAYQGKPYETALTEKSIKITLSRWGDRLPTLYNTLRKLADKLITLEEAAKTLGVTKSAVSNLRSRYGVAPGKLKAAPKPMGRYKKLAKTAESLVIDVIAGRKTAIAAAKEGEIPLRTFHRHLADVLRPQLLNEISHWSKNFRVALAWEIEKKRPRLTVEWRKWAEDHNLVLSKRGKWPETPADWREVSMRRLLVAFLSGEMSIDEMAAARGGEASVLESRFKAELAQMGMNPLSLTVHHQAAVAEIVLALDSHFRTGVST